MLSLTLFHVFSCIERLKKAPHDDDLSGAGAVFGGVVKIAIVEMDVVVWWYYMYSGVDYTCRVSWTFFLLNHPASMKIRTKQASKLNQKSPLFKTAWR